MQTKQKTVVIWDSFGERDITFFVADGDLSEFNNVYINSSDDRLDDFAKVTLDENYDVKYPTLDAFPINELLNGAKVIVAGFIP